VKRPSPASIPKKSAAAASKPAAAAAAKATPATSTGKITGNDIGKGTGKVAAKSTATKPMPPKAVPKASPPRRTLPVRRVILGLLGGIGSGKSTVADLVGRRAKVSVVDADTLAKEALDACARDGRLAESLGAWALGPNGTANRKAIAARAFDQPSVLRDLERLTHPAVLARINDAIETHRSGEGAPLLILDVPLLIEVGLERRCDALWFVDAADAVRFARAKQRLGLTPDDVRKREAAQSPLDRKRARADVVLRNDGPLPELEAQVDAALAALTE
jgi:dephospho-CoA kinase